MCEKALRRSGFHSDVNVQVGPFWRVSDSLLGVKQAILLSSPGSATIKVPYTVTVTGNGPFASLSRWEWQGANTAPTLTADRKAGRPPQLPCCRIQATI